MVNVIEIELSNEGKIFMICRQMYMDQHAVTLDRKFTFRDIEVIDDYEITYGAEITITVNIIFRGDEKDLLSKLVVTVDHWSDLINGCCWMKGTVVDRYFGYDQSVVDIYNMWQQNIFFDWWSEPLFSSRKQAYLVACLGFTGINTDVSSKLIYQLNLSLVKEKSDFFYLLGTEFFGERGYFGSSISTFQDCLSDIFRESGYQYDKTIKCLNIGDIADEKLRYTIEEVMRIFKKCGFAIDVL